MISTILLSCSLCIGGHGCFALDRHIAHISESIAQSRVNAALKQMENDSKMDYEKRVREFKEFINIWNGWAMVFVAALATIFGGLLPLFFQHMNSRTVGEAKKTIERMSRELESLNLEKLEFKAELYFNIARSAFETYRATSSISSLYNTFVHVNKCISANSELSCSDGVYSCAGFLNSINQLLSSPAKSSDRTQIIARMKGFRWSVSYKRIAELIDSAEETDTVKAAVKGYCFSVMSTFS